MPTHTDTPRQKNRGTENEMLKPGDPPRPATEPQGAEGSSKTRKTQTDPATGEPNRKPSN